jgi:hypothetical protein
MKPEILGICKQVLSFGVAGLALSLGFADRFRYLPPAVQKAIMARPHRVYFASPISISVPVLSSYWEHLGSVLLRVDFY